MLESIGAIWTYLQCEASVPYARAMADYRNSRVAGLRGVLTWTALVAIGLVITGCSDGSAAPGGSPASPEVPATEPDAGPGEQSGGQGEPGSGEGETPSSAPLPDGELVAAAPSDLAIGVAVAGGGHHAAGALARASALADATYAGLVAANFTSVSPENQLKWEWVRPERDTFDFEAADALVDFAESNGLEVRGHTLLWHSQNPAWLTAQEFTDAELRELLRDHIATVVGRYAGQIAQWDVANEIFDDEAKLRMEENPFIARFGIEIVADAFRWAHEADPDALLFLNDYSIESLGAKSDAYFELAQDLLADGVPLHGMGFQGHLSMAYPKPGTMTANFSRFADLGLEVAVTEADVRMSVDDDGAASAGDLAVQSEYFVELLDACLAVESCRSFTVWGLGDAYSWVPHFFSGEGAATLLDDEFAVKPAFTALAERLAAGR